MIFSAFFMRLIVLNQILVFLQLLQLDLGDFLNGKVSLLRVEKNFNFLQDCKEVTIVDASILWCDCLDALQGTHPHQDNRYIFLSHILERKDSGFCCANKLAFTTMGTNLEILHFSMTARWLQLFCIFQGFFSCYASAFTGFSALIISCSVQTA